MVPAVGILLASSIFHPRVTARHFELCPEMHFCKVTGMSQSQRHVQ